MSFFELVSYGREVDYTTVSGLPEMVKFSELVIVGRIQKVETGGIALGSPTVVAQLQVEQVLKGNDDNSEIYIEIITGPLATAKRLNGLLPLGPGLWFLQDAVASVSSPLDEERGEGLPQGERLFAAGSPQGLLMFEQDRLVQPLEPDPSLWLPDLAQYESLSAASRAVAASVANASF